jgi:HAD superfamily hydrolase (TIGR01509 family)
MDRIKYLKAVVFDYNGTLVDDVRIHAKSYWLAGQDLGFDLSMETVWRHVSQPPSQKRVLYYGEISDDRWEAVFGLKKKYYDELARGESIVFADAASALTELSKEFKLAVLSNTFRFFFDEFFPKSLAGLFETTLFFDEVKKPKPAAEPLLIVLNRLGLGAGQCCYVGDAIEDIQMARAAGAHALSVTTGGCDRAQLLTAGSEQVFDSLSEMADCLIRSQSG